GGGEKQSPAGQNRHQVGRRPKQSGAGARGRPPLLGPAGLSADMTPTVRTPAFDPMRTAPRRVLDNLDFPPRWGQGEIFTVIGQLRQSLAFDLIQRECQRHLAEAMMVTIRLAISS